MGQVGAFLHVEREGHNVRPATESVKDYEDFTLPLTREEQSRQASRCMNCGVAFCQCGVHLAGSKHAIGCPLQNLIPETNDLLYRGRFDDAVSRVSLTNPFPEFTGRVCPAPCETACNLGLNQAPVTINDNERALSDYAWEKGINPLPKPAANARTVSVIGSGPAGLAVGWEMARRGWKVAIYEKADRPGGLLMYGIPNMKLPKNVIERRVNLMKESGIEFFCNTDAASKAQEIAANSDAVVIATGAGVARDVALEGRSLDGIHFAVDYLTEVTSALLDGRDPSISAEGKDVAVIGGGDTGNDCVACALRQGAKSVTQIIRAQQPATTCDPHEKWPEDRGTLTQGYGQREADALFGQDPRIFSTDTTAFSGIGSVELVHTQKFSYEGGRHLLENTEAEIPAQLVLIAKGFTGTDPAIFEAFGVETPAKEQETHCLRTATTDKEAAIYVAGDALLGSTLVVNAMADALQCAKEIASA
jgi:glutamate synthase (NADPH/NADH) small chain